MTNNEPQLNKDSIEVFSRTAEELVRRAILESGQASYHRRAPNLSAVVLYDQAEAVIQKLLGVQPTSITAFLLLSAIAEGRLQFGSAIESLETAFSLGEPRSKKNLKRLARLRESMEWWQKLGLSPYHLAELGAYLTEVGVDAHCNDFRYTNAWLIETGIQTPEAMAGRFINLGAFTDFQVLANLVHS